MKNLYYILFVAVLLCGCYDDKGNYDYRTLGEVEISFPQTSYSLRVGDRLQIPATVTTTIPEDDLHYNWEVYGDTLNTWWNQYISIFEGKDLDYVCEIDGELFPREDTYDFRLNVTQVSTGVHFYSEVVEVTLIDVPSIYGALVLHGNGTSTDIGLIEADEFQLTAPASSITPQVLPNYYSEANDGVMIDGEGWKVTQLFHGNTSYPDNIVVVALTDESSAIAESKNLTRTGEWNDLFAGNLNQGEPQFCQVMSSTDCYVMDGGDFFIKQYTRATFTTPLFVARDYGYDFYPYIWVPTTGNLQGVFFDRTTQGFVGQTQISVIAGLGAFVSINATAEGPVTGIPFNPADMQADLIYMDEGGRTNHHVAVMKGNDGNYFLAEMDFTAGSNAEVPQYRYDLSGISDVQDENVVDWAFGSSYMNMGYYATSTGVYNFSLDAGGAVNPEPLRLQSNEVVDFDGEITYMEILKYYDSNRYYMSNVEMVVGTYNGTEGSGKLYSIELEPYSGRAISVKEYEGFNRIYDVDIKAY